MPPTPTHAWFNFSFAENVLAAGRWFVQESRKGAPSPAIPIFFRNRRRDEQPGGACVLTGNKEATLGFILAGCGAGKQNARPLGLSVCRLKNIQISLNLEGMIARRI